MSKFDSIFNKAIGEYLEEALSDKDKARVNDWAKGSNKFSDKLFGGPDKDKETFQRRYFDFEHQEDSPVQKDIESHLSKHGYSVLDYKQGRVKDTQGRETRIGRALGRTKADPELLKKFENDPVRTNKSESNLRILLSRHPHDVAGMTSQGHSWCGPGGSCMNFYQGSNKHYLPRDVKHGTHIAYLVKHDDEGHPQQPIARIAIKKFSSGKSNILGVEKIYGDAPKGFKEQVQAILDREHNQYQPIGVYAKNKNVYDDTGEKEKHHIGADLDKAISHPDYRMREIAFERGTGFTPEQITKGIGDVDYRVQAAAVKRPNLSDEHITHALQDWKHSVVKKTVLDRSDLKPHHLEQALNDSDPYVAGRAAAHKNATFEQFEKGFNSEDKITKRFALKSHHAKDHHIEAGLNDEDLAVKVAAVSNPNTKAHHLDRAFNLASMEHHPIKTAALEHPNASDDLIMKGLSHGDIVLQRSAISNPSIKPHHLDFATSSAAHRYLRDLAYQHPNLQSQHIDKAFAAFDAEEPESSSELFTAMGHPTAVKPHHIDRAIEIGNTSIIKKAIKNPNSTEQHIEKVLKTPKFKGSVYDAARLHQETLKHPKIKSHHLDLAVALNNYDVDVDVASHRKAKSHHLDAILSRDNAEPALQVLQRHDLTASHIEKALKHKNEKVRRAASEHAHFNTLDPSVGIKSGHTDVAKFTLNNHPGIEDHHISAALEDPYLEGNALLHSKAKPHHFDKALKAAKSDYHYGSILSDVLKNPNASTSHVEIGLNHNKWDIRAAAARHPSATPEQLDKAMEQHAGEDANHGVYRKISVLQNKNVQARHVEKGLRDADIEVRAHAFKTNHPSITTDHISYGIKDHRGVAEQALAHQNVNSDHLHQALDKGDYALNALVARHAKTTSDHLERILTGDQFARDTKADAISHPNATRAQIERAANHSDEVVRAAAKARLKKPKLIKEKAETLDYAMSCVIESHCKVDKNDSWLKDLRRIKEADPISKAILSFRR